jgi:5S rRNA maturation endonuclease (ribonuclease M5)
MDFHYFTDFHLQYTILSSPFKKIETLKELDDYRENHDVVVLYVVDESGDDLKKEASTLY